MVFDCANELHLYVLNVEIATCCIMRIGVVEAMLYRSALSTTRRLRPGECEEAFT